MNAFDIQKLVSESGIPRRTIHFYVQQGILPPPQGAGLAAYYTEDHLLRLRLIPVMRQQGLRLDEIRERFAKMTTEEMRRAVEKTSSTPVALPSKRSIHEQPGAQLGWGERRHIHYVLPAGITLVVPEEINPVDRQRVQQLLLAARQIFSSIYSLDPLARDLAAETTPASPEDGEASSSEQEE